MMLFMGCAKLHSYSCLALCNNRKKETYYINSFIK